MLTRTYIALARRRAAWLSLVATLLGAGVVPALHVGVHLVEETEAGRGHRVAPPPARAHRTAHGHRHVGPGHHAHHAGATPAAAPSEPPRHHHHHDGDGGDGREPTRHGRGAPEHLGAVLLVAAAPVVPPSPVPALAPRAARPAAGRLIAVEPRPNAIRGPPDALRRPDRNAA